MTSAYRARAVGRTARVQAAKRLAALGSTLPEMEDIPRRRAPVKRLSALDAESERLAALQLDAIELAIPRTLRAQLRKLLGGLPIGSRLQFYQTPKGSLAGLTPIQALQAGKVADVKRAAEGFRER